jgi:hypothetical protein
MSTRVVFLEVKASVHGADSLTRVVFLEVKAAGAWDRQH